MAFIMEKNIVESNISAIPLAMSGLNIGVLYFGDSGIIAQRFGLMNCFAMAECCLWIRGKATTICKICESDSSKQQSK